ncbi:MAG: P-type conjugative transfer protein TrbG [Syntrophobacteraceae bacterium]
MKKYLVVLAVLLFPVAAVSAAPGPGVSNMENMYLSGKNPKLNAQERAGVRIAERWRKGGATGMKPVAGQRGSVEFVFGSSDPTVVCAPLQVCDVALEPGEQVNNVNVGDPRWSIGPAISGSGRDQVEHLIIKPQDVGLSTTLVVTTNRRTYHMRLVSCRARTMPYVQFIYPNEVQKGWAALRKRDKAFSEEQEESASNAASREYLGDLDFNYRIVGNARWRPVRVYNDGVKTIIQMPSVMSQTEAPALLVIRGDNKGLFNWFKSPQKVLVNYRVQGDRYIVDCVFSKAILIAGVGSNQERVTIARCDGQRPAVSEVADTGE